MALHIHIVVVVEVDLMHDLLGQRREGLADIDILFGRNLKELHAVLHSDTLAARLGNC